MPCLTKSISNLLKIFHTDVPIIYNLITPNGDSKNDTWVIERIGHHPGHTLEVYNSLGNSVFTSYEYMNTWDAKDKHGRSLPSGIYWYVIKAPTLQKTLQGTLLIER